MNLALTLERAGRTDEAIRTYETALEVWPGHLASVQALARLCVVERREEPRLAEWLAQIALQGETERWRDWALRERARSQR